VDNAKGVLIILVVLGHLLESVQGWENETLRAFLTLIYVFHMPAFVFLAGITSKQDRLVARLGNLTIILVMFQLLYVAPSTVVKGEYPIGPLQPYWMLWFLLSMIWWMALLPLISRLRGSLVIAISLALLAGVMPWNGYILSSSRTLVYLPFFVAGHLYGRKLCSALPVTLRVKYGLAAMAVALAFMLYIGNIGHAWLNGYASFDMLSIEMWPGIATRALVMLGATFAGWAFLAWVPTSLSIISRVGAASLSVFLLHGFIVKAAQPVLKRALDVHPGLAITIAALVALGTCWLLGRVMVDTVIRRIVGWIQEALAIRERKRA